MEKKQTDIVAALTIAEKVYAALCEACRPGATEDTLDAVARLAADGHELQYDLLTGPRTAQIEGGATGRVLRRGRSGAFFAAFRTARSYFPPRFFFLFRLFIRLKFQQRCGFVNRRRSRFFRERQLGKRFGFAAA